MIDCGLSVGMIYPKEEADDKEEPEEEAASQAAIGPDQNAIDQAVEKRLRDLLGDQLYESLQRFNESEEKAQSIKEILPDFDKLEEILSSGVVLKAIFITHDHMDHYAALPYLVERFYADLEIPTIYGSK